MWSTYVMGSRVFICGGKSSEHQVSLMSISSLLGELGSHLGAYYVLGIRRSGEWVYCGQNGFLENADDPKSIKLKDNLPLITVTPGNRAPFQVDGRKRLEDVSCIFPLVHGTNCEDGILQGFLQTLGIPFVGSLTSGSSLCMDKDLTKRILKSHGIPVVPWQIYKKGDDLRLAFQKAQAEFGLPVFVKPSRSGSSVGVSKVKKSEEFEEALHEALREDSVVLIEKFYPSREIECSVLGNGPFQASRTGEIIPQHEFYSYEAKYIDPNGAKLVIPSEVGQTVEKKIQEYSIKACEALEVRGLARVDFLLTENGLIHLNEVNTLPGFTPISMYPKMWAASGLSYKDLVDKLFTLAQEYMGE
ncbi:MAG: D-alanine--D-alanine ligase A [Bdellovibrionales bacterium CG10_big_fil_rev_8_21_14_0_10_45_34]|nr:MAG: D-alanine--D-alanine ligase A [Bdellovibrionales bacterium CG10_big_fil_rev_8_21_14_0_10_45_34]